MSDKGDEMGQWLIKNESGLPESEELVGFDTAYKTVRDTPGASAWKTVSGNGHMMTYNMIVCAVVVVEVIKQNYPGGNVRYGQRSSRR